MEEQLEKLRLDYEQNVQLEETERRDKRESQKNTDLRTQESDATSVSTYDSDKEDEIESSGQSRHKKVGT